jgi:hypothetical protein
VRYLILALVGCQSSSSILASHDRSGMDSAAEAQVDLSLPADWHLSRHPCPGPRTDAVAFAPPAIHVGCGGNLRGGGVYVSRDDGWSARPELSRVRALDVGLSEDGSMWVAGPEGVWSVGSDVRREHPVAANGVEAAADVLWIASEGGLVRRWGEGPWTTRWEGEAVRSVAVHGGSAFAVLRDTPRVLVPSADATGGWPDLEVHLPVAERLDDLAVDGAGVLVGGVAGDRGVLAWSESDPAALAGWQVWRLDGWSVATRIRGVCRDGPQLVAVGEAGAGGMWLQSNDGGRSWVDRGSELGVPPLDGCRLVDGRLALVGADGFVAVGPAGG